MLDRSYSASGSSEKRCRCHPPGRDLGGFAPAPDDFGEVEYLKTYRLSAAQAKRAYLLSKLSEHDWDLDATAEFFRQPRAAFIRGLEKAGFGYFLKRQVLEEAAREGKRKVKGKRRRDSGVFS